MQCGRLSVRRQLGTAELEQEVAPLLGRRQLLEGTLEVGDSALGRALSESVGTRAAERLDDVGVAPRRHSEHVRRKPLLRCAGLGEQPIARSWRSVRSPAGTSP